MRVCITSYHNQCKIDLDTWGKCQMCHFLSLAAAWNWSMPFSEFGLSICQICKIYLSIWMIFLQNIYFLNWGIQLFFDTI